MGIPSFKMLAEENETVPDSLLQKG
jgi:hypothetical protein